MPCRLLRCESDENSSRSSRCQVQRMNLRSDVENFLVSDEALSVDSCRVSVERDPVLPIQRPFNTEFERDDAPGRTEKNVPADTLRKLTADIGRKTELCTDVRVG